MNFGIEELTRKANSAKEASRKLAYISTDIKNRALVSISQAILDSESSILDANKLDYKTAKEAGMNTAMLDRLMLSSDRLESIAQDVRVVAELPDPIGEVIEERILPNGLELIKRRVPLGVIGAIYESRPNVTVDISVLCLKAGNGVLLRGGKETINSNIALAKVIQDSAYKAGIPEGAIQLIESTDRDLVDHMLKMKEYIDLIIPRGGAGLIKFVSESSLIPVVTGGIGVCHTYVDRTADISKAVNIAYNAKVQRPTVCNALDTLIVHKDIAKSYLPKIAAKWAEAGVEMHCDTTAMSVLQSIPSLNLKCAAEDDWGKEYLALIAAIKVVDSLDEAINHIKVYGSGHSEAIVAEDKNTYLRFLNEVDAACVYANASTRFTDGGQFGMGAEIGISTQKFHARGPMSLREITSYKWIIIGSGQVRP